MNPGKLGQSLLVLAVMVTACTETDGESQDPLEPAGTPAVMTKTAGDGQQGPAGTLLLAPLEVEVTNESGDPVEAVEVRFTASAGKVVPSRARTDSQGRRSVRLLLPDTQKVVKVVASSEGLADVEFTAEAITAPRNPYQFPVTISGRFIVDAVGRHLFLNGDAAWGIAVQLDSSQVQTYLDARVQQGVNAILFRATEHRFTDAAPANAFGELPFTRTLPGGEENFTALNPDYWAHVEWIVAEARKRGILCLITPAYVGYRLGNQGWATEMKANGRTRLMSYGDSIGRRFRDYGNVIWVMGGDSEPRVEGMDVTAEVNAVAEGIQGSMADAIFTAHSVREESALDSYDQPWLDVNSTYSDIHDGPRRLRADWERTDGDGEPAMPSFWIEGYYENEHSMTPAQLRSQMYWSILGGAMGHIYGAHPVWSFDAPQAAGFGDTSVFPYDTWRHALDTEASKSLLHVRRLLDTQPIQLLEPVYGDEVITDGREDGWSVTLPWSTSRPEFVAAALATDGSVAITYLPNSRTVTVDMSVITTDTLATALWIDPASGDTTRIGELPAAGERDFTPPRDGDWVLVIEDTPH